MKIAVIGTVGVPARYGGFETLAEQLALGIPADHHALVLYCQRSAYPNEDLSIPFAGHRRVAVPLRANGAQSLVHDALAMCHAAWAARADTALILGYSGAWFLPVLRLVRPGMRVVTNIDGMEWRRDKFGPGTRGLLRVLEWFATRFSQHVIADNAALVELARQVHRIEPHLIAYGGDHSVVTPDPFMSLEAGYFLSIARIEPENNCDLILRACHDAGIRLVFVGNWEASAYGRDLLKRFAGHDRLLLLGPIYDTRKLAHLRQGAAGYLHGHSVGGTNPSLVEAIFHSARLLAFDCAYNRATLGGAGQYFQDVDSLVSLLRQPDSGRVADVELAKLRQQYRWTQIVQDYLQVCGAD